MTSWRVAALLAAFCSAGWAQLTPEMRIVAGHITANSLRGDVSFLASDLLEGRDTPSRGLDIAGEYIASQFRRLGLEPAGDDGYFQSVMLRAGRCGFSEVTERRGDSARL